MAEDVSDEHQDHLPEELDVTAYVGPYVFPNINRRRIPAVMYAALAVLCFAGWVWSTNTGLLAAAVLLAAISAYHFATAWNLAVDQTQALVVATRAVGFPDARRITKSLAHFKTVAVVATALWAVVSSVTSSAGINRPQAGGYNISQLALHRQSLLFLEGL